MVNLTRTLTATAMVAAVLLLYAGSAQAQASRTWVSGVGNDANPCSRTAPCKTFAGAISKTAASGEINCLDSGGFGAVTITKAITISCEGVIAGVLASLTNGIIVNAGASDQVTLRGLDINGFGNGINGIRFLAGKALLVDNVQIYGFTTHGIDVALSAGGSSVDVRNTVINNTGGDGIRVASSVGGASLAADHVNISRTVNGIEVAAGGVGTVSNSMMYANSNGVAATAGGAILNVSSSEFANNNFGANASISGASIGLNNNDLYGNNQAVNAVPGSTFASANNNKFNNNGSNGPSPGVVMVIH